MMLHKFTRLAVIMAMSTMGESPAISQEMSVRKVYSASSACEAEQSFAKQTRTTITDKSRGQSRPISALGNLLIQVANGQYDTYNGKGPARQGEAGGTVAFIYNTRTNVQMLNRASTSWRPRLPGLYNPGFTPALGNEGWIRSTQPTQIVISVP